ncbi:hypothetical protein [Microbulbifer sp. ZKSA002]|uniref:hypothetical protein n=1 Tax=Microbulbifer sp. ZKSA002 TaxID=3243388 RepID=UPI0040391351
MAKERQQVKKEGYKNIGDFHNGIYDCDYVSPYTKSANNIDASVMVLLQDWLGVDKLSGPIIQDAVDLGHIPSLPTNKRLKDLLQRHFGLSLSDIYATNVFPLIKYGNLSADVPAKDMVWVAQKFAVPQIEVVAPTIVICLGLKTFNAIRKAVGLKSCKNLAEALQSSFDIAGIRVCCQAHTGALGQNSRGRDRVEKDWQAMVNSIEV